MTTTPSPKEQIRKRKAELGLTTSQIAERGGLPRPTVDAYVCGKATPTYRNLISLAIALECSADYLAGFTDDPARCVPVSERDRVAEAQALIDHIVTRRANELMDEQQFRAAGALLSAIGTVREVTGTGQ